jgi:hypothetical protein
MKFTKHALQKLETLFGELGYVIRYEKGNFNSGYAIVESRKIVVINKFFETEARMGVLLDILQSITFDPGILGEKSAKFYQQIQLSQTEEEAEEA